MAPEKKKPRRSPRLNSKPAEEEAALLVPPAAVILPGAALPLRYAAPHLVQSALSLYNLFSPQLSESEKNALSLTATWLLPYRHLLTRLALRSPKHLHHKAELEELLARRPKVESLTGKVINA